jgi:aryl-alcohol dehydrogenase-like predicted oxidoreductase
MEYRRLGQSGLYVSELCLGTMTFGRETEKKDSLRIMDRFFDAGGNFFDTADIYSHGASESILGAWLNEKKREEIVLATKVRFRVGNGPNNTGLSRKRIIAGVEQSLGRLGTDYIDLYQLHCWDDTTPVEETMQALDDVVRAGKVRYIGVSNFAGYQLQKAIQVSDRRNGTRCISLQPQYNLLCRTIEWEVVPAALAEGVGLIPWSPLRGGWLSGKFRRGMDSPPEGTRVALAGRKGWGESWQAYNIERTWRILDDLFVAASESGKTPAQTAINWLLQKPGVVAPIIGARNLEQLEDNLGAAGWELDPELMDLLDDVSEPSLPYPYDLIRNVQGRLPF